MHFPRPDEIKQKKAKKSKASSFPRPPADGGTLAQADKDRPRKKKSKGYWRRFARHHGALGFATFFFTVILFFIIGLKALISPGPVYCRSATCSAQVSATTNAVFIALGCIFYLPMAVVHGLLIACPGAMMDHPRRHKMMAFSAIILIIWSFMHLIGTEVYRSYVFELSTVKPYSLSLTPSKDPQQPEMSFLTLSARDLNSQYLAGENVQAVVYHVRGDELLLSDIPPLNKPIYLAPRAWSIDDTQGVITAQLPVDILSEGAWYIMALVPSKGSGSDTKPIDRHLLWFDEVTMETGEVYERVYVDRRAYAFCRYVGGACTVQRGDFL